MDDSPTLDGTDRESDCDLDSLYDSIKEHDDIRYYVSHKLCPKSKCHRNSIKEYDDIPGTYCVVCPIYCAQISNWKSILRLYQGEWCLWLLCAHYTLCYFHINSSSMMTSGTVCPIFIYIYNLRFYQEA